MKIDMPAFDDAEGWLKRAREKRAKRWTIIGPDSFDELLPDDGPLLDEVQVSNAAIDSYEMACQAFEKRLMRAQPEELRTKPLFTEKMLFGSLVDWCKETFDLRAYGVTRMADNDQAILVSFSRKPTDDELRALHDVLAGRVAQSPQVAAKDV